MKDVTVTGVEELRVGDPSSRKGKCIGSFTRIGCGTGDEKLRGVHEHPNSVELDVGERLAIRGVAGAFDAAFGNAGD